MYIGMANRHMKKHSAPLVARETFVKTAMRYHFAHFTMANIKMTDPPGPVRTWSRQDPHTLLVEDKTVSSLWKTDWRLLTKFSIHLTYDTAIPALEMGKHTFQQKLVHE